MVYKIVNKDELYHYGVKGMKWGVRRNAKHYKNGKLTEKGYAKYYTDGKLNRRGEKAKKKATAVKNFGQSGVFSRTIGYGAMAYGARNSAAASRYLSAMLHAKGNMTITKMAAKGASYGSRKAVAGAYIASMAAVKVATIYPYASAVYRDTRYRLDDGYHNKINTLAGLNASEKTQRKKKG